MSCWEKKEVTNQRTPVGADGALLWTPVPPRPSVPLADASTFPSQLPPTSYPRWLCHISTAHVSILSYSCFPGFSGNKFPFYSRGEKKKKKRSRQSYLKVPAYLASSLSCLSRSSPARAQSPLFSIPSEFCLSRVLQLQRFYLPLCFNSWKPVKMYNYLFPRENVFPSPHTCLYLSHYPFLS